MVETKTISGFAFHRCHDRLWEWVTDFEERQEYIKSTKPLEEVELRLRLFKIIPTALLPQGLQEARVAYVKADVAYGKAWDAYNKVSAACNKAEAAYDKAEVAYGKAWAACAKDMEALHKRLCPDCPWDGKSIFSEGR